MKHFILFLGFIYFSTNIANATVNDPQFLLPKIDAFLANQPFASAFQAGDNIQYGSTECIGSLPCGSEVMMTAVVEAISDSQVVINQFGSDNTLKGKAQVRVEQWDAINRNYLRARINNIESFGFVITINDFKTTLCPREIYLTAEDQCATVSLRGVNGINQVSEYQFTLWNSPMALAQIISYQQTDKMAFQRLIKYRLTGIHRK